MHYTGEVYRHPMEANTPLLEITIGCSHNKCSFCTMYRQTPFRISKLEDIEEDLKELKSYAMPIKRIYLLNADPWVLSAKKLINVGELINKYIPEIETITGYASIQNIKNKSLEDLKHLRSLHFNDLHIGLESGYEPAVQMMHKGFSIAEAREQIIKLNTAGFRYDALLMMGIAGKGNSKVNTDATAALLNEFPPYMVSIMPTSVTPGSPLEKICDDGIYVEQTELEMLQEEVMLLNALNFEDCYFFGSHNFNLVPVSGSLKNKDKIIGELERAMRSLDPQILNSVKPRGHI